MDSTHPKLSKTVLRCSGSVLVVEFYFQNTVFLIEKYASAGVKVDSVGNKLAGATVEMKRHDLEAYTMRVAGRAHNAKEGNGIHIELAEGDFVSGIPLS